MKAKQAFTAPSSDDISSENSVDQLNTELTLLNNELAKAEDEKEALREERNYLDSLVAERDDEIETLEKENQELREANEMLQIKLRLFTEKFKKVTIRVRPPREKEDEICPICFNDVTGEILMGSIMCYSTHAVCVDCFNQLREREHDKLLCPTCRFQWFEPDIMIWAPNYE